MHFFFLSALICLVFLPHSTYTGCMRLVKENLNWGKKSELKAEVLRGIKEIGSVIYWMGLLDIVLVSVQTLHHDNYVSGISNWKNVVLIWGKLVATEFAFIFNYLQFIGISLAVLVKHKHRHDIFSIHGLYFSHSSLDFL